MAVPDKTTARGLLVGSPVMPKVVVSVPGAEGLKVTLIRAISPRHKRPCAVVSFGEIHRIGASDGDGGDGYSGATRIRHRDGPGPPRCSHGKAAKINAGGGKTYHRSSGHRTCIVAEARDDT